MADLPVPAHPLNAPARFHALVPAAGVGSRAGTQGPKQYEPLAGRMLVQHTLAALRAVARIDAILVVVAPGDNELQSTGHYRVSRRGGDSRAASVANGLADLLEHGARPADWVLVHDAARCLVTPQMVDALLDACADDEVGGLLALPLADTLKEEEGGRSAGTLPRGGKWLAQTPQMFRIGVLQQALSAAGAQVTDEASAIEALGLRPRLVPGSAQNFKVTWPEDFALAEAVLGSRKA